jgi:hypothetical protein
MICGTLTPMEVPRDMLVVCVGMVVACAFDASGGGGAATLDMSGSGSSSSASGAEAEDGTSATASTSGGPGSGPADTSGGSRGTGDSTSATDDFESTADGETTEAELPEEHLFNTDHAACNGPSWCFYSPSGDPVGSRTWTQECFTPSISPPYEITELHWTVADAGVSPVQLRMELRARVDGQPAPDPPSAESEPLPVSYSQAGEHTYVFPNPPVIDAQEFCIGLQIPEGGTDGAVGIARVSTNEVAGVSWRRIQSSDVCNTHPSWIDTTASGLTLHGNFCISVKVRAVR